MATTPFIGEIRNFSFSFPPRGWALCNGQLLSIAQNQALFSILGTTYGGNGIQTFGLPNLQGRVAVGMGTSNTLGLVTGTATVTLNTSQVPAHTHNANGSSTVVTNGSGTPGPTVLPGTFVTGNYYGTSAGAALAAGTVGPTGGQPHENRQPFLVSNFCVALVGIFPSRN